MTTNLVTDAARDRVETNDQGEQVVKPGKHALFFLTPVTFPFDVATFPVQLIIFFFQPHPGWC